MEPITIALITVFLVFILILLGVHIGVALALLSVIGIWAITGKPQVAISLLNTTSYSAIMDYIFAVIPLFVLMGLLATMSGATRDLFSASQVIFGRIRGGIGIATVIANAVFAAITGVSVASAAVFSKLAIPEMERLNYDRKFSYGIVASSALLGMLIPPSVLMIIWGIVAEVSIGRLFIGGMLPGVVLACLFAIYSMVAAVARPDIAPNPRSEGYRPITGAEKISGLGVIILILLVLGGLYGGLFTPSESAAVGAIGGLLLAIIKGIGWAGIREAIIDSGKTIAPIMFLLLTAQMYTRLLATGGVVNLIQDSIASAGFAPIVVVLVMVVIWLILGTLLDSASIILLTVPIFWPLAQGFGYDPYVFGIFGILAIEAGLLTPPVGLLVYAVKGAVADKSVTLTEIFAGSIPYWLLILVLMAIILAVPEIVTILMPE